MEEKKNKSPIIYVIAILLMIACFAGGFFVGKIIKDSNKKENNSENKEEKKEEPTYLLDNETINELESMRTDLKGLLKDNYKAYDIKCSYTSEENMETKNDYVELSNDSINVIIDKLKTAAKVDKDSPAGFIGCSPRNITYVINKTEANDENKKFIVMYGDDKTLLVGYNQTGSIYYFNDASEINNLLENLIK